MKTIFFLGLLFLIGQQCALGQSDADTTTTESTTTESTTTESTTTESTPSTTTESTTTESTTTESTPSTTTESTTTESTPSTTTESTTKPSTTTANTAKKGSSSTASSTKCPGGVPMLYKGGKPLKCCVDSASAVLCAARAKRGQCSSDKTNMAMLCCGTCYKQDASFLPKKQ